MQQSPASSGRIVANGYLKPKDLCLIPFRLVIALQAREDQDFRGADAAASQATEGLVEAGLLAVWNGQRPTRDVTAGDNRYSCNNTSFASSAGGRRSART